MSERSSVDQAYWERNQLVRHLTFIYPSHVGIDPDAESPEWAYVVYVMSPEGQLSWHVHSSEINRDFCHLKISPQMVWDGHTTSEKYERLRAIHD